MHGNPATDDKETRIKKENEKQEQSESIIQSADSTLNQIADMSAKLDSIMIQLEKLKK